MLRATLLEKEQNEGLRENTTKNKTEKNNTKEKHMKFLGEWEDWNIE